MIDIKNEIRAKITDIFENQVTLNCLGRDITLVKVLGVDMQPQPNNNETKEFLITFKGQVADEHGGIIEDCYTCTANVKVDVSIKTEITNVCSITKK